MERKQLAHSAHVRSVHDLIRLNFEETPVIEFVESKAEIETRRDTVFFRRVVASWI